MLVVQLVGSDSILAAAEGDQRATKLESCLAAADVYRTSARSHKSMSSTRDDDHCSTVLVSKALEEMQAQGAEECVLEVESTNVGALGLYQNLGFIRDKRLERYYLSGNDAFRMKLLFPLPPPACSPSAESSHTSLVARNSRDETPVSRLYV